MTKLYCPKGHNVNFMYPVEFAESTGEIIDYDVYYCAYCLNKDSGFDGRHYLSIDCLTEPETVDLEKKMSTESQKCEHVNDTDAVDIPKTESKIAVDRVVEALVKVRCADDVDAVCNSTLLDALIHNLVQELNK